MRTLFKKMTLVSLLLLGLQPVLPGAHADEILTGASGPFGIGLVVGQPGNWGVIGNLWIDSINSLQPAIKFDDANQAILQLDYLWHRYDILRPQSGALPFYIGVGGDLTLENSAAVGVRVPLGISYQFPPSTPLDVFLQVVPTLWLSTGNNALYLYAEAGARLYP